MEFEVVDHSPEWKRKFHQEAELIRRNVNNPEMTLSIFHIGSTSVPGLRAKPIIDMLLVVEDVHSLDREQETFETMGYEYMGEYGLPGRRYMRKGGDARTHQIHAYQYDNSHEILRHVAFRDYLRQHEEIAREYGELKTRLASLYPDDIEGYINGKNDFVKETEKRALREFWKEMADI